MIFKKKQPQIKYIASACLCGIPCRYDGKAKTNKRVRKLMKEGKVFPLCPELMAGFSIPRPPATRHDNGRIIENESGRDVTEFYQTGVSRAMEICENLNIQNAFLKKGSPTCGEDGLFTEKLREQEIAPEIMDKDTKIN